MPKLLITLATLVAVAAAATPAHAARVVNLRLSGTHVWQQWIERDPAPPTYGGVPYYTACSPIAPTVKYTLVRTSEPPDATGTDQLSYVAVAAPFFPGQVTGGYANPFSVPFGPVSVPLPEALTNPGAHGTFPGVHVATIGYGLAFVGIGLGAPVELANVRITKYRGVWKSPGACAAAGMPTYSALQAPWG